LRALYIAAACALAVDRLDRASELSQDLLTRARRSSDPEDMLRALDVAVGVEMAFERLDEARALVNEYLVLAREFEDPVRIADVSNRVATLALERGEWSDAVAACEEGLLRRADLPASHVGMLLASLALALAMASDVDRALDASAESLELASRLADATGVACALLPITYLAARSDPARAGPLVLTLARLARLGSVWFERFEQSVHEQTLTMIGEIVNGGTLDESTADVDLEAAAELGRREVMEMRASSDSHAS